jgi:quercetin dioxygenase-like cupin family protein
MPTAGFDTTVLLFGERSDGRISIVENVLPPHWQGPPLHVHDFDEAFYVLEGELTFQLADERLTAGPGTLAFAAGGVPHTLANLAGRQARYLLTCTPAGFERYFARLAAERAGVQPPPEALLPTPPVTVVGPPIGG